MRGPETHGAHGVLEPTETAQPPSLAERVDLLEGALEQRCATAALPSLTVAFGVNPAGQARGQESSRAG